MEGRGRRVLLIIDVQALFLSGRTQPVAEFLQDLVRRENFDLVIQSCWRNFPGSPYETRLGYGLGMDPEEARPFIPLPGSPLLLRSTYSAVTKDLLRLLHKEDELYVAGLETDACVLATLFDLWDEGFTFHVYQKGVGTSREDLSAPSLELIRRQFGTHVIK